MKKTKKKLKIVPIGILLLLIISSVLCYKYFFAKDLKPIKTEKLFIGSNELSEYTKEVPEKYEKINIVRGEQVLAYKKNILLENDKVEYYEIKYKNKKYLIEKNKLVRDKEDIVQEKTLYLRTSSTVYENPETPNIKTFLKKGSQLDIVGYKNLLSDGTVEMYKVKSGENEGYIYSKYIVKNKELADAVYTEIHDIHKDRKYYFELYGGSASSLDYYPYEKPKFKNNELKAETKTYYLAGSRYILNNIDEYINVAKQYGANAFVVDIKDGALAYKSEVSKNYTQKSYDTAMNTVENYKKAIDKLKNAGFYTIGRIVLFNDKLFAQDNPNDCIKTPNGSSTSWVSGYSRHAWEYNVKLAQEAIDLFDFNEIQYDYVRFPEASFNWSKNNYNFQNNYNEEKAETIQNFLFYATDQIHKKNKYISIDVFGECSGTYVTAYGQYWPAISNIVDVVSSMPYTDHFDRSNSEYWTKPYNTMLNWGKGAAARQKEIKTPAGVRTWITAYDTPYWNVTTVYDDSKIEEQVRGLVDAGLGHGFITWNASSNINKYRQIGPAFNKEY